MRKDSEPEDPLPGDRGELTVRDPKRRRLTAAGEMETATAPVDVQHATSTTCASGGASGMVGASSGAPALPPTVGRLLLRSAQLKVALVIGIDRTRSLAELAYVAPSTAAVADKLVELGYSVSRVDNATKDGMVAALEVFQKSLSLGCSAILYFCGRGWQCAGAADCLLAPVDFRRGNPTGTVPRVLPAALHHLLLPS
jgi:hypothetical protein